LRRGSLAPHGPVVLFADTVGFIRKLPHHLVASFRSTLGEVTAADLVVHLVDRSHPLWPAQQEVADGVMRELGVDAQRVLLVFNKADRLGPSERSGPGLWISAATGEGLDELRATLAERLGVRAPSAAAGG
jgi:GTP-binding protein HflX